MTTRDFIFGGLVLFTSGLYALITFFPGAFKEGTPHFYAIFGISILVFLFPFVYAFFYLRKNKEIQNEQQKNISLQSTSIKNADQVIIQLPRLAQIFSWRLKVTHMAFVAIIPCLQIILAAIFFFKGFYQQENLTHMILVIHLGALIIPIFIYPIVTYVDKGALKLLGSQPTRIPQIVANKDGVSFPFETFTGRGIETAVKYKQTEIFIYWSDIRKWDVTAAVDAPSAAYFIRAAIPAINISSGRLCILRREMAGHRQLFRDEISLITFAQHYLGQRLVINDRLAYEV